MKRTSLEEFIANSKSASFRRLNAGIARVLPANPGAEAGPDIAVAPAVSDQGPQCDAAPALDSVSKVQKGGVGPAPKRPRVDFWLFRVRLLDAEAKYASLKPILDGLVVAGLIPGDREKDIELHVEQEVVPKDKEGTGVVITYA